MLFIQGCHTFVTPLVTPVSSNTEPDLGIGGPARAKFVVDFKHKITFFV